MMNDGISIPESASSETVFPANLCANKNKNKIKCTRLFPFRTHVPSGKWEVDAAYKNICWYMKASVRTMPTAWASKLFAPETR